MNRRDCRSRQHLNVGGPIFPVDTMIVSIIASPRPDGYGTALARRAAEGAGSVGKEVREYRLNDMTSFRQCQNCEACKKVGRCVLKDDISPIIDDIRDADGVILCTSINFNDADGLFKMVLDRFYCFLDANASTILPKGKRVMVIVTAGADDSSADRVATDLEKVMTQHFFFESVGRIAYCTWMMPVGMPIDDDVLDKAYESGRGFSSGSS